MFSYNLWVIQKEKEKEEINKLKELVKINRMQKSIHIAKVDLSDTNEYMDTYLERLKQNKIINSRPLNHSHNNSTGNLLKSNEDSKKVITSYQEDRQKEKKQIDNLISVIDVVPRFKLEREYDINGTEKKNGNCSKLVNYKSISSPSNPKNLRMLDYCHNSRNLNIFSNSNTSKNINNKLISSSNNEQKEVKIRKMFKINRLRSISPEVKLKSKIKLPSLKNKKGVTQFNNIDNIIKAQLKPIASLNSLIPRPLKKKNQIYYYRISKHYREQFKLYFEHRTNWRHIQIIPNSEGKEETNQNGPPINLKWKFSSKKIDYKKIRFDPKNKNEMLQVVNIFELFEELGNKNLFFLNMLEYCNENKINVFEIVPMTVIINNGKGLKNSIQELKELMDIFSSVKIDQNKNGTLLPTLYQDIFVKKESQKQKKDLTNVHIYIPNTFVSNNNYWIIKPNNLYQGKLISMSNDINSIEKTVHNLFICGSLGEKKQLPSVSSSDASPKTNRRNNRHIPDSVIIQKYLDRPLLYHKRKFDIRCYVLIDCDFNVFYCREGHLKASSKEYDLDNRDLFVHITNYSFQKKCNNFSKFEYGNEISYSMFRSFLQSNEKDTKLFDEAIDTMKKYIKISMLSVGSKKLIKSKNVLCFQIFGYDFIIDENFKPWILEINDNPGLSISSPVIAKLIPRMFDDAMRLTIDKIFDTVYDESVIEKETNQYKSKYQLDGYSDYENVFEFLGNIKNE